MNSGKIIKCFFSIILTCCFYYKTSAQNLKKSGTDYETDFSKLKTFSAVGKEKRLLFSDRETEIFNHTGKGCLTHMWFGGDWPGYENTRIRIYVDEEVMPSIDMEMGPGHGVGSGYGDTNSPWGIDKFGKTGQPSGVYNTYRIPFGKHVRVTAQLAKGMTINPPFWWIIRGTENLPVYIGGVKLPETARLKLYKRENLSVKRLEEFDMCNTLKSGMIYEVMISARSSNLNFMEATVRAYINGIASPMLLSSGLEDYFLGTYYFRKGLYYTPVAGLTYIDNTKSSFSAYRFHDDDPEFFHNGLRLTNKAGEQESDTGKVFGDPQETIYTTYTWLYEW